jgi:hypothetical protein
MCLNLMKENRSDRYRINDFDGYEEHVCENKRE